MPSNTEARVEPEITGRTTGGLGWPTGQTGQPDKPASGSDKPASGSEPGTGGTISPDFPKYQRCRALGGDSNFVNDTAAVPTDLGPVSGILVRHRLWWNVPALRAVTLRGHAIRPRFWNKAVSQEQAEHIQALFSDKDRVSWAWFVLQTAQDFEHFLELIEAPNPNSKFQIPNLKS